MSPASLSAPALAVQVYHSGRSFSVAVCSDDRYRAAHYEFQPLLAPNVQSLHPVWILPPPEVDPVRKDRKSAGIASALGSRSIASSSASWKPVRIVKMSSTSSYEMAVTGVAAISSVVQRLPCSCESRRAVMTFDVPQSINSCDSGPTDVSRVVDRSRTIPGRGGCLSASVTVVPS